LLWLVSLQNPNVAAGFRLRPHPEGCGYKHAEGAATATAEQEETSMNPHEKNLNWLRDTIEHLSDCQQQLEWARDRLTIRVLTDSILRDLDCCRRLCESVRQRGGVLVN
jgi:hypothetical protein